MNQQQPERAFDGLISLGISADLIASSGVPAEAYAVVYDKLRKIPRKIGISAPWQLQALAGIMEPDNDFSQYSKEKNSSGQTLLHFLAFSGNLAALQDVDYAAPGQIAEKDSNGTHVGHYAALSGDLETLQWVFAKRPELLRQKNSDGEGVALWAVLSENTDMLDWLLNIDPNLIMDSTKLGFNLAHAAAKIGSIKVLEWIRAKRAELLEGENSDGYTIAHYAAGSGHVHVLEWIDQYDPELMEKAAHNEPKFNIAHRAAYYGQQNVLEWLHEKKPALLMQKCSRNASIAHYVAWSGNIDAMEWLASNTQYSLEGADVSGGSIQLYAAASKNPRMLTRVYELMGEPQELDLSSLRTYTNSSSKRHAAEGLLYLLDHKPDLLDIKSLFPMKPEARKPLEKSITANRIIKKTRHNFFALREFSESVAGTSDKPDGISALRTCSQQLSDSFLDRLRPKRKKTSTLAGAVDKLLCFLETREYVQISVAELSALQRGQVGKIIANNPYLEEQLYCLLKTTPASASPSC